MSTYTDKPMDTFGAQHTGSPGGNKRKQHSQQSRQLLSCTKCRERKVKCDRTKPCSACCARGQPRECQFVAEGDDYVPIQQSYELRNVRAENIRLKERLRASGIPFDDEDSDQAVSPDSQSGERPNFAPRRRAARQKRFQGSEWQDSIYFGSPGLVSVVTDFATVNIKPGSTSLAHLMPRGSDFHTSKNPPPSPYPFPTLFKASADDWVPELLACLPPKDDLLECLGAFENRVNVCSFPHVPVEITRSEVERFLTDAPRNAEMCPDMLALLFAAIALGGQHSVWDRSGKEWKPDAISMELRKGDVYIAAAMQALRMASFMHKPSLLCIQALIMIGPYLSNSGRFLDAWTLFGTTIRLAHSIGLHRHPRYLDPAPPTQQECFVRQTLWWWMLHMDEQYSMTLGRPLGISGIGDCPPPVELTTNAQLLRFGDFVNRFTIMARQVLSSDRLTNAKVDEFTDSFRGLLDTMPESLQFKKTWINKAKELPEWPLNAMAVAYYCKTHTYLILLNRQRLEKYSTQTPGPEAKTPSFRTVNQMQARPSPTTSTDVPLRGRALVLVSSEEILDAFFFCYDRLQAALISWTMGQQAFNACMLLLLDALELRRITSGIATVERAYVVFTQLLDVHKLASLAIERISWGLNELCNMRGPTEPSRPPEGEFNDTRITETANEAMQGLRAMYDDTVMNATGMLLLEDPGLQGFVPEAFAPISWNMAGFESLSPLHFKEEQEPSHRKTKQQTESLGSPVEDDFQDLRSTGRMQGLRRSTTMRSAPTRYATSGLDDLQPLGAGVRASRTSLAKPTIQHRYHPFQRNERRSHYEHPPHSRHPPAGNMNRVHQPTARAFDKAGLDIAIMSPGIHQLQASQLRHNSCPSIPGQPTSAPPMLRSVDTSASAPTVSRRSALDTPTGPSSVFDQATFPTGHEDLQAGCPTGQDTSWSTRASGRSAIESGLSISPMTDTGQNNPGLWDGSMQLAYPFTTPMSQSLSSTTASTVAPGYFDDWTTRQWMDGNAPD